MSRRKGSKNRSTLVKELVERGADEADLAGLSYEDLEGRAEHALAERPPPPPVQHRLLIDPDEASAIYLAAGLKLGEMARYFAPGGKDVRGHTVLLPHHLLSRLRGVYTARNTDAAYGIAKVTLDRAYLWLLWQQRRGEVAGPAHDDVRIWVV